MSMQLCYRTQAGDTFYSQPVYGGDATISFDGGTPANNVIFAVVCNTDYEFSEEARTSKFNYKLKLGTGAVQAASTDLRWFNWEDTIEDSNYDPNNPRPVVDNTEFYLNPNPVETNSTFNVMFNSGKPRFEISIADINGYVLYQESNCRWNQSFSTSMMTQGMYFVTVTTSSFQQTAKLIVQ